MHDDITTSAKITREANPWCRAELKGAPADKVYQYTTYVAKIW